MYSLSLYILSSMHKSYATFLPLIVVKGLNLFYVTFNKSLKSHGNSFLKFQAKLQWFQVDKKCILTSYRYEKKAAIDKLYKEE